MNQTAVMSPQGTIALVTSLALSTYAEEAGHCSHVLDCVRRRQLRGPPKPCNHDFIGSEEPSRLGECEASDLADSTTTLHMHSPTWSHIPCINRPLPALELSGIMPRPGGPRSYEAGIAYDL